MSKSIISLIVVLITLGFSILYVKPEYDLMQTHRSDLAKLNDIFNNADRIKGLISQTKQTLDGVGTAERARFEIFLPSTSDPIRLANNLQHIGYKNGIVLENIKVEETSASSGQKSATATVGGLVQGAINVFTPGRKGDASGPASDKVNINEGGTAGNTPDKKYVATRASFSFTSTLESFGLLLNDLEKSLRLMSIIKLSFNPTAEAGATQASKTVGPPAYQFSVTVEVYSLR